MASVTIVAACVLIQWALDWEGNVARIKESIRIAKSKGARLRVGPELEICGHGCLDHFLESDTYLHCWEMLLQVLTDESCYGIILDIGTPVEHKGRRYNWYLSDIIRWQDPFDLPENGIAKRWEPSRAEVLCCLGYYSKDKIEDFFLPETIIDIQGSNTVPIGHEDISFSGVLLTPSSYSDLDTRMPSSLSSDREITQIRTISTASHHELGAFDARFNRLQVSARDLGGVLLYADNRGGGGDRTYSDGCAMIFVNGELVAQGSQFSLDDVEVVTTGITVTHTSIGLTDQHRHDSAVFEDTKPMVEMDLQNGHVGISSPRQNDPIECQSLPIAEQMAKGPACWLWDYLRRSKAAGFVIPLSGGIDSGCTATIIYSMCRLVMKGLEEGNQQVRADVQDIVGSKIWLPKTPQELCNRILHTMYMGVSGHSSNKTRSRARRLAQHLGAYHTDMNIDNAFQAEKDLLRQALGYTPTFDSGRPEENLALQNIQARIRMVTAYYFAQMLPATRGRPGRGTLLVLGSVNVEECLRGSLTKHDCSSADLSPIGSFSKLQIQDFMEWARISFDLPILQEFLDATPSAELEPTPYGQDDFKDMGMTHEELSTFGKLRKEHRLGPFSMFQKVLKQWQYEKSPKTTAELVKKFHHFYGINRHKMTTLTPAYHAGQSNPDDHRYDMRPILYPRYEASWSCKRIDEVAEDFEKIKAEDP